MKIDIDCICCFIQQAEKILKKFVMDREKRIEILKNILKNIFEINLTNLKPIELYPYCYDILHKELNIPDLYRQEKEETNQIAVKISEYFIKRIRKKETLKNAIKLSIAGNLIDYGIRDLQNIINGKIIKTIESYIKKSFHIDHFKEFLAILSKSTQLLFLPDNSGEIIFDKIFLTILKETYPHIKIYIAGRDINVLNDVTYEELIALGFNKIGEVVRNGIKIPGAVKSLFNTDFLNIWDKSDIIIAKGQGNFEGLSEIKDKNIFFALIAKCPMVAKNIGVPQMSMIFMSSNLSF